MKAWQWIKGFMTALILMFGIFGWAGAYLEYEKVKKLEKRDQTARRYGRKPDHVSYKDYAEKLRNKADQIEKEDTINNYFKDLYSDLVNITGKRFDPCDPQD